MPIFSRPRIAFPSVSSPMRFPIYTLISPAIGSSFLGPYAPVPDSEGIRFNELLTMLTNSRICTSVSSTSVMRGLLTDYAGQISEIESIFNRVLALNPIVPDDPLLPPPTFEYSLTDAPDADLQRRLSEFCVSNDIGYLVELYRSIMKQFLAEDTPRYHLVLGYRAAAMRTSLIHGAVKLTISPPAYAVEWRKAEHIEGFLTRKATEEISITSSIVLHAISQMWLIDTKIDALADIRICDVPADLIDETAVEYFEGIAEVTTAFGYISELSQESRAIASAFNLFESLGETADEQRRSFCAAGSFNELVSSFRELLAEYRSRITLPLLSKANGR